MKTNPNVKSRSREEHGYAIFVGNSKTTGSAGGSQKLSFCTVYLSERSEESSCFYKENVKGFKKGSLREGAGTVGD